MNAGKRDKESWVPAPNGSKALPIAAVVSILVLGGMFAAGALFVVRSSDQAEAEAVSRCQRMVDQERRASDDRYAPAAAVVRVEAKLDSLTEQIADMRGEVRAMRSEMRSAVASRSSPRRRTR